VPPGHLVDPENPPFGFSVWRSRENMAHGREMAQVHEGSIPSCKYILFYKWSFID